MFVFFSQLWYVFSRLIAGAVWGFLWPDPKAKISFVFWESLSPPTLFSSMSQLFFAEMLLPCLLLLLRLLTVQADCACYCCNYVFCRETYSGSFPTTNIGDCTTTACDSIFPKQCPQWLFVGSATVQSRMCGRRCWWEIPEKIKELDEKHAWVQSKSRTSAFPLVVRVPHGVLLKRITKMLLICLFLRLPKSYFFLDSPNTLNFHIIWHFPPAIFSKNGRIRQSVTPGFASQCYAPATFRGSNGLAGYSWKNNCVALPAPKRCHYCFQSGFWFVCISDEVQRSRVLFFSRSFRGCLNSSICLSTHETIGVGVFTY